MCWNMLGLTINLRLTTGEINASRVASEFGTMRVFCHFLIFLVDMERTRSLCARLWSKREMWPF